VTVLQHLILPDPALGLEPRLYFSIGSADAPNASQDPVQCHAGGLKIDPHAQVSLDSYFNLFNPGKWQALCDLHSLSLHLSGTGDVALEILFRTRDGTLTCLHHQQVDLASDITIPISWIPKITTNAPDQAGVIFVRLTAEQDGAWVQSVDFATQDAPLRLPKLAISVTTFRREAVVEQTVERLASFLAKTEFGAQMQFILVDNGNSAEMRDTAQMTRLVNRNLGGSGGFARGLLEAQAKGCSHVLFMDDDAAIHMEAIHRTYALLAFAQDPSVAVAGAMIASNRPGDMWENGALFDGKCMRMFGGADLGDIADITDMETAQDFGLEWDKKRGLVRAPCDTIYAGWWFFAFPIASVRHHPFPFFVRGDDVSFSLANPFHIVTLNGVVSVAEDFTMKESPLTWYLDLRSHLVHHLSLPDMARSRWHLLRMVIWFVLRNIMRFQYETIAALLLAFKDVMQGPLFFATQGDMAARRAVLGAMQKTEKWQPIDNLDLSERRSLRGSQGWRKWIFRATGNGHLLPFFTRWGDRVVVPGVNRGSYTLIWGASQITYLNEAGDMGYQTRQSKRQFVKLSLCLAWQSLRFLVGYQALRSAYRRAYPDLTSAWFWQGQLGLTEQADKGRADRDA